jgi:PAS domain S-box-containing protein
MAEGESSIGKWSALKRYPRVVNYGGSALTTWLALSLWSLLPIMRRDPFALFLAAVVVTARFFGFGPALFCSVLSTAVLDFIVFPFNPAFRVHTMGDLQRLAAFLVVAVLVGSLARQKTRAESKADRTTREMAAIVECSEDAIFSTNSEGVITSWNRGAEHLYGYTADEAVGMLVHLIAPPERRAESERNRLLLNEGGSVPSYQTERMHKDGRRVAVMLSVSPLRNAQGETVGASAIARDITTQKRSEEAIRRSEKLAAAGRLAASVAHEINNPLEAVLNLLYLARHDPSRADQYLKTAEEEVGRVAAIAQQTLGFVRDTAVPAPMNPAAIMDEMLQLYSRKLDSKHIQVARRYRKPSQIVGYAGELRQLLSNLLVNAFDAMETGGVLQVRVTSGHQWSDDAEGIRITIADNGCGIPSEIVDRIFEPFYTTKQEAGTGLGLWVSHGIVQKRGGTIRFRSRVTSGRSGTVFTVFIPTVHEAVLVS